MTTIEKLILFVSCRSATKGTLAAFPAPTNQYRVDHLKKEVHSMLCENPKNENGWYALIGESLARTNRKEIKAGTHPAWVWFERDDWEETTIGVL